MTDDDLFEKFRGWIAQGLITYGSYVGGRANAFKATGEAAETIALHTPLHAIGHEHGDPISLLLTNELIELFGQVRFQQLCTQAQQHANDNEQQRGR